MKSKMSLERTRKLKSGDSVYSLKGTKKDENALFKLALCSEGLTIKDLIYQANGKFNKTFKQLMIGAFVKHSLECLVKTNKTNES